MNEDINTVDELLDEVNAQALEELSSCLDLLTTAYIEYNESKTDELKEIYNEAVFDLKTLLQDYAGEDTSLVEEAFDELFSEIKEFI